MSGDLIRHYLAQDDWTPDISKFGIDIWMTTHALTGGFAVCQARLGAKVHDPKDPGADLGPMFRQVVGTILRLAATARRSSWLPIHGSHDVPAYGFERILEPPPLEVDTFRLLTEFQTGSHTLEATWAEMFSPASLAAVRILAHQAGATVDAARDRLEADEAGRARLTTLESGRGAGRLPLPGRRLGEAHLRPRRRRPAARGGHRPLRRGARPDLLRARRQPRSSRPAPARPTRRRIQVERQAREFELLKPYLVDRWNAAG